MDDECVQARDANPEYDFLRCLDNTACPRSGRVKAVMAASAVMATEPGGGSVPEQGTSLIFDRTPLEPHKPITRSPRRRSGSGGPQHNWRALSLGVHARLTAGTVTAHHLITAGHRARVNRSWLSGVNALALTPIRTLRLHPTPNPRPNPSPTASPSPDPYHRTPARPAFSAGASTARVSFGRSSFGR